MSMIFPVITELKINATANALIVKPRYVELIECSLRNLGKKGVSCQYAIFARNDIRSTAITLSGV